jgi:hypothetical protein
MLVRSDARIRTCFEAARSANRIRKRPADATSVIAVAMGRGRFWLRFLRSKIRDRYRTELAQKSLAKHGFRRRPL